MDVSWLGIMDIERLITAMFIAMISEFEFEFKENFSKKSRYTLGTKIDFLFLEIIELVFAASYLDKKEKLPYLQKASKRLDLLKFLLLISWELRSLDNKKYILLSEHLNEIGKMLGGWIKGLQK